MLSLDGFSVQVESVKDRASEVLNSVVSSPNAFEEGALKAGAVGSAKVDLAECTALQKRKLLTKVSITTYLLAKGARFTTKPQVLTTDLTPEMLADGYEGRLCTFAVKHPSDFFFLSF